MKKLISTFVLIIAIVFAGQAQKKHKKGKKEQLTVEQATSLQVKKMVLDLDLTPAQQKKIEPLVQKQIAERRAMMEERKKMHEERKKIQKEEAYKKREEMLDKRIAFQKEMKSILNDKQYASFKEMAKEREQMAKRKMKMAKKRKMKKKARRRK